MKGNKVENGFTRVGFLKRGVAVTIDGLILSPVIFIPYFLGINLYNKKTIIAYVAINSISYLYAIILPVLFGGTIGKLLLKIKIVNEEGHYISFIQSVLRWLPDLLSFVVLIILAIITKQSHVFSTLNVISKLLNFFVIIEIVVLLFNKSRRTVHDYIAKTYVVEK